MLPLQVVVFARLPFAFGARGARYQAATDSAVIFDSKTTRLTAGKDAPILTVSVLLYYGLVQLVWLNFATNAYAWVPYRFYPLDPAI
jgi:hypothetical protein